MSVGLPPSNMRAALADIRDGARNVYLWPMLGWLEIKQRYRRSVLGPFWLTISTGAMILGMGPLYGRLFGQNISDYFPYLAVSFVVWLLIANLINEACMSFIGAQDYIKQIRIPLTVHVLRMVWKNLIIFAHNLVIVALVMLFYRPALHWSLLLVPLAIGLVAINGMWIGVLFGMLCARFRDIPQLVASFVQVAFFLTPVLWKADMLGRHRWTADLNPLFHFLEIVREPIVSGQPALRSWAAALAITVIGCLATILVFSRFRGRVAYWV